MAEKQEHLFQYIIYEQEFWKGWSKMDSWYKKRGKQQALQFRFSVSTLMRGQFLLLINPKNSNGRHNLNLSADLRAEIPEFFKIQSFFV